MSQESQDDRSCGANKTLEQVRNAMKEIPGLINTINQSPVIARSYFAFSRILADGKLPLAIQQQIALTVKNETRTSSDIANHCCRAKAAIEFAQKLVAEPEAIRQSDLAILRNAGFDDIEVGEIVLHVALNRFRVYLNNVTQAWS